MKMTEELLKKKEIEIIIIPAKDNKHKYFAIVIDKEDPLKFHHLIKFGNHYKKYFIDNKNKKARQLYLDNHRTRENSTKAGILTKGFWEHYILWNKPTVAESVRFLNKKFDGIFFRYRDQYDI